VHTAVGLVLILHVGNKGQPDVLFSNMGVFASSFMGDKLPLATMSMRAQNDCCNVWRLRAGRRTLRHAAVCTLYDAA